MIDYLPQKLLKELVKYKSRMLNEIRIRKDCPVVITVDGERIQLKKVFFSAIELENLILKVCDNSLHVYDEQIVNGYVTDKNGVRIGLSGEFVVKDKKVTAIRNITSLCIRIPNAIKNVSSEFFNKVYEGGSVLVISPAGVGKTSFIRDLTNNLCENSLKNVVVVDERNEISMKTSDGNIYLNKNVDVLTYATKEYGFNQAIRTLNPDVIVTDEITSFDDARSIINAIYGGVNVIATVHGNCIEGCFSRSYMTDVYSERVFDYLVLITVVSGKRKYLYFDKDFKRICLY